MDIVGSIGRAFKGIGSQALGTLLTPGSPHSAGALAVTLALAVLLMLRGRRRPTRPAVLARALFPRRILRSASGQADLAMFAWSVLVAGAMLGWALISAETVRGAVAHALGASGEGARPSGWLATAVATPILFLAYELAYWFDHWLKHRVPVLWHFHKVHHQAEHLSLLTNARVHPVDTVIFLNIVAVAMGTAAALVDAALGARAAALTIGGANATVLVFQVANTHLQHSHLWVGAGPRWPRALLGPAHHQIHHSADPAHFNRNLGSSLALFDRLFGTYCQPGPARGALRLGVDDGSRAPHGSYAVLVAPFAAALGEIVRPFAARGSRRSSGEA